MMSKHFATPFTPSSMSSKCRRVCIVELETVACQVCVEDDIPPSEALQTLQAVSPGMAPGKWNAPPQALNPLPASCRLTQTRLALNYQVSAPLFCPAVAVCTCVCRTQQGACREETQGAGWGQGGEHLQNKGLTLEFIRRKMRNFHRGRSGDVGYHCFFLHSSFPSGAGDLSLPTQWFKNKKKKKQVFIDRRPSRRNHTADAFHARCHVGQSGPQNFMFYVSTLSNKVNQQRNG